MFDTDLIHEVPLRYCSTICHAGYSGSDYGMGIVGNCVGSTKSREPSMDGCKSYVSQSITNVLYAVSTKLSIFLLKRLKLFHTLTFKVTKETNSLALTSQHRGESSRGLR